MIPSGRARFRTRRTSTCSSPRSRRSSSIPIDGVRHPWWNQTLARVNDSVVRIGVIQGEYHWHHHDDDDEFFYVVDGRLLIDLDPSSDGMTPGRVIELRPREGFVVPKGVVHRTRTPERTVILMVETATIVPTG